MRSFFRNNAEKNVLYSNISFFHFKLIWKNKNMKKTIKIKKNYEFNITFKRGKYFSGKLIECFYIKNNKNINCFGIAISSKICNAVKRNRIKRVIRECYRKQEENINDGNTFVFLWKRKAEIEECTYNNVFKDMKKIFEKMGVYINEKNND